VKQLTVEEWQQEISYGLEYRALYGMEDDWGRIESIFYNGHPSNRTSGSNIIYSTGDAFLSTVHVPNPMILTKPKTLQQIEWAPIVEKMDNDLFCEMKVKREFAAAGLYSYLWGTGIVKLGYDSEYGYNPKLDAAGMNEPIGATLTRMSKDRELIEYNDSRPGMPWAKACLPHDIVVPYGTRDLDNCPWIAHRVVRHIDAIKSDVKYSGTKNLKPVMSMKDFVESYQTVMKPYRIGPDLVANKSTEEGEGDASFCELWEIHDKRTMRIYVIATGHDKFLRSEPNYLQIRGLPFVEVSFTPKGRTFWRTSDAAYLLAHHAELADITLQARKQRRLNVLKFLGRKGMLSEDEKRKMLSRDIGAFAEVNDNGKPLTDAIIPMPMSGANEFLYRELEDVRSAARETVGFDRNSYGEYRGARTTATEVDAVQSAKDFRMGRRQSLLADSYVDFAHKLNGIVFRFWTTPKVAEVVGQDGLMQWMQFVPAELKGQYTLECVFDDGPMESFNSRQQMAMQMYQMSFQDPSIDPVQARRFLARSSSNAAFGGMFKPGVMPGTVPQMGAGGGQPPASRQQPAGGGRSPQPSAGQR
jgi:hypothetical protein